MKENIYTIPVIESFENGGECAFCAMYERLTKDAVDFMLGSAYMEDDIRMETNRLGFCEGHLEKLYNQQNRLGLALIMYTHLHDVNLELNKLLSGMDKSGGGIFKKSAEGKTSKMINYTQKLRKSCYICRRVDGTFDRYIDTYFYLWKKDDDIKEMTKKSKGFCLRHYSVLLENAEKKLPSGDFNEFLALTAPIQLKSFKELEDDLDWFIKKYDYRFASEPWKNSKDSLQRALKKMQSIDARDK